MSKAQVSLQQPLPKEASPQETMISLYAELNLSEDPQKIRELSSSILSFMSQAEGSYFETSLQLIIKMFNKGYANLLIQSPEIIEKIMKYFVFLFKKYEKEQTKDLRYRKLFVLSVVAELIRQEPKFLVPFSRDFLLKVFQIQCENLGSLDERNQVLAILGSIFGNMSKQSKLIKELKIGKSIKEAILSNYILIGESSTLRLFNQSILQLQTRGTVIFTLCELQRYKIKEILLKSISNSHAENLVQYLQKLFPRSKDDLKIKKQ